MTARGQWADAQTVLRSGVSERDLSDWVCDLARLCGWKVARWPTFRATATDPGVPDLCLSRGGVVLLCELKAAKGKLSPEQEDWQREAGAHHRLWRTADWYDGTVEAALR